MEVDEKKSVDYSVTLTEFNFGLMSVTMKCLSFSTIRPTILFPILPY